MQTSSHAVSPNWFDIAGAETIAKVEAAIKADPAFLAEAQLDLNAAVERRMGISFPIPLALNISGDTGIVRPVGRGGRAGAASTRDADTSGELTDADLDLVAGGSSVRVKNNANEY